MEKGMGRGGYVTDQRSSCYSYVNRNEIGVQIRWS
jgi:hypothetical protein